MIDDKIKVLEAFQGLTIEVIGDEIWVSGDTRSHHAALKGIGFWFAPLKKMWHWKVETSTATTHLKMSDIRAKHGVSRKVVTVGY